MSWESPIQVIYNQVRWQFEEDVCKAVRECNIKVNKEELIKALEYDRGQYDKGYSDGRLDRDREIVRCKECKWIDLCKDPEYYEYKGANGFCSRGERRE